MSKKDLESFMAEYGEIAMLKDMAGHFNELSNQWRDHDGQVSYAFADASYQLSLASKRFSEIEKEKSLEQNPFTSSKLKEYKELITYFDSLSFWQSLRLTLSANEDFKSKMSRFRELKKWLDTNAGK